MKLAPLALLSVLLLPGASMAQRRITAPVDIAVGPAAFLFFGPVFEDQPIHTGLKISVEAVLDKEWLKKNQALIPRSQRRRLSGISEIRYAPGVVKLIPDSIIISPKYRDTGMYGATWKPLGFGLGLTPSPVRLSLDAGLILTYAYLFSDRLPDTHFLRPGLQLGADLEFQISKSFLVSFGWASALYVPQKLGTFNEIKPLDASIFHVGQAYMLLHFRVPVTVSL
ncbi:hypothetical protein [Hyalangium rubrum]|uniref:Outer membrane protein beta-barrel domain-containing protein n=1 Tax=Hyalangium rubrum TaxID=3103134 RepID=A0ABU5HFH1_9BACT|nr:hypothetical protein [Hyalangium sp. s54d21]MDY7232106.1 hypothetical protein [Hyalangium sp. s54d21]